MTINIFQRIYNFLKYTGYIYPLIAVTLAIFTILLTTSCGNDSGITPSNASDAPKNLVANTISRDEIELAWQDNSTDEDGFYIERKEGPWGVFQRIARVGANITTYNDGDKSLTPDTSYYYRVAFYKGNEVSAYSNTASATTLKKVLSLRKESEEAFFEKGESLDTEAGKEDGNGHSAEDECIQAEEITDGNQIPCDTSPEELVLNADSPFMSPVVLGSLIYGDDMEAGLKSINGLSEKQFEELKGIAVYVQDSFLSLDLPSEEANVNVKENGLVEITRKTGGILLTADQRLMELLETDQYVEFMRWAEGVAKRNEGQYEKGKIPLVQPPPVNDYHELRNEGQRDTEDDSMGEEQKKPPNGEGMH